MLKLENVKIGSWLDDGTGIFEVVSEYDSYHNWFLVKEVLFNENGDYSISDEELRMTKNEVLHAKLLN